MIPDHMSVYLKKEEPTKVLYGLILNDTTIKTIEELIRNDPRMNYKKKKTTEGTLEIYIIKHHKYNQKLNKKSILKENEYILFGYRDDETYNELTLHSHHSQETIKSYYEQIEWIDQKNETSTLTVHGFKLSIHYSDAYSNTAIMTTLIVESSNAGLGRTLISLGVTDSLEDAKQKALPIFIEHVNLQLKTLHQLQQKLTLLTL